MDIRSFKALTFDCYGTLIDWERGILDALRAWRERTRPSVDDDSLLTVFGESESAREAADPREPYLRILQGVLADLAEQFGVDSTSAEREDFGRSVQHWPAFADSPAALRDLKRRYQLVIVSNVDRASFAHSNAKLGVEFDAVITAEDVGSYKPALAHFETMFARLAALGVQRDHILHVAQSLFHDHEPALSQGLATAWIDRRAHKDGWGATRPPGGDVRPDFVFESLADLARACGA